MKAFSPNILFIRPIAVNFIFYEYDAFTAVYTRNSLGDEIANVKFFYYDIFNHFYAVRPASYRY